VRAGEAGGAGRRSRSSCPGGRWRTRTWLELRHSRAVDVAQLRGYSSAPAGGRAAAEAELLREVAAQAIVAHGRSSVPRRCQPLGGGGGGAGGRIREEEQKEKKEEGRLELEEGETLGFRSYLYQIRNLLSAHLSGRWAVPRAGPTC
jgi:hypothetical protein